MDDVDHTHVVAVLYCKPDHKVDIKLNTEYHKNKKRRRGKVCLPSEAVPWLLFEESSLVALNDAQICGEERHILCQIKDRM